jgi:hypothetical protein
MASISEVSHKLKRLVLMLSSSHAGEVAAAAAAIDRTLRGAGCDWHDLAAVIVAPAKPQPKPQSRPATEILDWREMRDFCLDHEDLLRPREAEFVQDLQRWRGRLTEKQDGWLVAIFERIRRQSSA